MNPQSGMTLVSVIIPSFNREELLSETLDSIAAQTYPHWEAIVVDDHSEDSSLLVAQKYALRDPRFRVFLRTDQEKGANPCRNQGLAAASGKYIIFLDSDDLLGPTCLAQRVADMEGSPESDFAVYFTELFTRSIGDQGVLWNIYTSESDLHRFLSMDSVWLTTGPIWRKDSIMRLGGFDKNLLSYQDWSIHLRAIIAEFKYIKRPICDNFHRHDYSRKTTISSISWISPDHLLSQEKLFETIIAKLREANALDTEVRLRAAGLFWFLARRWQKISDYTNADRLWRRAYTLGFCSRIIYLVGCSIFRIYNFPGGGRAARLIQKSWPSQYYRFHSPHMWTTPVSVGVGNALKR